MQPAAGRHCPSCGVPAVNARCRICGARWSASARWIVRCWTWSADDGQPQDQEGEDMAPDPKPKPKKDDYVQCAGCGDLVPRRRLIQSEPDVFDDVTQPTPTCPFCGSEVPA